ncbi:hypothetical protein [Enterovirga sp.]|jgi:hypothetical protein|uniref:hypothetical protein n=1 Tax=Enterovirga sp. TaxID=2026350 RepID=UPI00261F8048|nr:hypothetical protein [Enterovirga sp.]MDB5589603.1 hypothetical protein [Enterovirga sp.]
MTGPKILLAALAASALAGCSSLDSAGSSARDLGSSLGGGFTRNTDTYGTGRRVDVYGGSNAPVLPTIGASGYGK